MEKLWSNMLKALAALGGAAAGALGGWDPLLRVLTAMMCADYISGIAVALMGKSRKTEYGGLSSKVGAVGLARKGLMMLVVLAAAMLDSAMGGGAPVCRDAACWFYIANEGLSLMENLGLAGVPFPDGMKELLGQKQKEGEKNNGIDA